MSQYIEDEKVTIRVSPIQFLAVLVYLLADRQDKTFEAAAKELGMPYGPLRTALTYLHKMFNRWTPREIGPVRLLEQDYLLELDVERSVAWGPLEMFGLFYIADTGCFDPHVLVARYLAKDPEIKEFPSASFLDRLSRIFVPPTPQNISPEKEYQVLLRYSLRLSRAETFLRNLLSVIARWKAPVEERLRKLSRRDAAT